MTVLFDIKTKILGLNTSAKFVVRDDQSDFKVHTRKTLKKWNDVIFRVKFVELFGSYLNDVTQFKIFLIPLSPIVTSQTPPPPI